MPTYEPTLNSSRCANVRHVFKCVTRVKARSLRSRIPAMYSKCQNAVPHVSNLARYAREFQQEGPKGQRTDPATGEFLVKSCPKMTKMANERTLQQGNSRSKVPKNDENRRKRAKSLGTPRSTRKRGARLTPVRRRTLPQLYRSYLKV